MRTKQFELKNCLFGIVLAIGLSRLPIANFFYTLPLLFVGGMVRNKKEMTLSFAISLIAIVALVYLECLNSGDLQLALFVVSLLIPVGIGLGSLCWYLLDQYTYKIRFIASSVIVGLVSLAFLLFLGSDNSSFVSFVDEMVVLYSQVLATDLEVNTSIIVQVMTLSLKLMLVPLMVLLMGVIELLSEALMHKSDESWQDKIANIKVLNDFVWVFLVAFFAALGCSWLKAPETLTIVVWNLALISAIVYGIQGYAILLFVIRKKTKNLKASKLVINMFIFMLIPGLNIAVIVGLPLLGVLETWITFRKPNKENSYEDHFESGRT